MPEGIPRDIDVTDRSRLSDLPRFVRHSRVDAFCFFVLKMLPPEDILRANDRIKPHIRRTPLEYSHWLSHEGNSRVYVKLGG